MAISAEDEHTHKITKLKEGFQAEKRAIMADMENKNVSSN
jgi:hypothetical protein